ncbi:MAG: hypothetical protein HC803_07525, partial [Saprospiraceae bacterium]|nr:hypothetical protein [Saprospiraceae bacterium]
QHLNKNDIPEMFRNNVGMDGSVFHKNHPYYQNANATAANIKNNWQPFNQIERLLRIPFNTSQHSKKPPRKKQNNN